MSGEEDLRFGRESVHLITKGLNAAIGELKEIGSATDAVMGSGFQNLTLSGMEAGGPELADAFEGFCGRWEWGVRALVQDANELAARLGLAAGLLHEEDRYWAGTLKVTVNSVVATGNPHATEEEIAQQSYREIVTPDAPDYSAESFRQAGEDMRQTWLDTGRSVVTEGQGGQAAAGFRELIGLDEDAYDRGVDEVFGPSPEEHAAQQEPGGEPDREPPGGGR
ncbi:hypothetical protein [Streptomyces xinghaiensis]|uniref:hypothetical protein n=1 Tax=Streptomyces xinghaiensis TaxID=1038928 RepID=UPI002E0D488F|nr:hypothetical protein OG463_09630 [Streptomyces xinghaiensis]